MATFYGLLVSNLLVNPAGEHMQRVAYEERKRAEIALHSIVLMAEGATLLEAQEILNSYVSKEKRVNLLEGMAGAA
jgi:flagellar motor component MotA